MKNGARTKNLIYATLLATIFHNTAFGQAWPAGTSHFEYNAGPAAAEERATEIINLYAEQPENKYISEQLTPAQKFRFTFGAMMLRTNYAKNAVKIFAIGQDAVDDAELVKLPGTGTGYSTRVQNIANHFGVDSSVATSNASFQTIKGQYGSFGQIFVKKGDDGKETIEQGKIVDTYLWSMFNGKNSVIAAHREKAWEWELKNNPDSLRLIILFGGASQDAFAEFLSKRGFRVGTRTSEAFIKKIRVPEMKLVFGGGNNEFPVLQTKESKDLYQELVGRKLDYANEQDQQAAVEALKKAGASAIARMAFTGGGIADSGLVHAAQLGGYNLDKVEKLENGKWVETHSLKGLKLSDGTVLNKEIAFVASPHPTALSKNAAEASDKINEIFSKVEDLIGGQNAIEPDVDADGKKLVNHFGKDAFEYGRAYLPRRVVPFGAPDSILRPHSSADRLGPQVLVSEPPSRDDLKAAGVKKLEDIFDAKLIEAAKNATPIAALNPDDLWAQHSRGGKTRAMADSGPGAEMARLMVENLDRDVLKFTQAPVLGFFAHYRGTFNQPRVLIVHDPMDLEDRNTFRAATGARGQALQGMMRDLGVENQQLVLASAPVDFTDITPQNHEAIRAGTAKYRQVMLKQILSQNSVEVIFTDGRLAAFDVPRILSILGSKVKVINIKRGDNPWAGILDAGKEASATLPQFANRKVTGGQGAIPISHLPWNSRDWERVTNGTVIEANAPFRGKTYAIVTPNFVAQQVLKPLPATVQAVKATQQELLTAKIRGAHQSIQEFLSGAKAPKNSK